MADNSPCEDWDIDITCCPNWLPDETTIPEPDPSGVADRLAAQAFAITWVSNFLWKRSRRRYGVCEVTAFACPPYCHCTPCNCGPAHVIELSPDVPVTEIDEIRNVCADTVIDPSRYAIVNGRGVGLVDRTCGWLTGSPVDCELQIVYSVGYVPDVEALAAAGALACAFVDNCTATNCKAGDFLKMTTGFYKTGKRNLVLTGVPLTDHWLIEVNRGGTSGMLDPSNLSAFSLS